MISAPSVTIHRFEQVGHLRARDFRRRQLVRTARVAISTLIGAGAIDCLVPLPAWVRALVTVSVLVYVVREVATGSRTGERDVQTESALARRIEDRLPNLDNALIHAVQFAPAVALYPDHPGTDRMRLEIARAERLSEVLDPAVVVPREPLVRERRRLAAIFGLFALSLLLFPRAYRFEPERLFLFWSDYPPYSLTDFDVVPPEGHVRAGESLTISIRTSGLIPHRMDIVAGPIGGEGRSVPASETGPGKFSATLEGIDRQTWFYASGDTGRSARHWILVDPTPHVRELTVTLHPPEYAHAADETRDLTSNTPIEARAGTRVRMSVETDAPLASGTLTVTDAGGRAVAAALTISRDAPRAAIGAFTVQSDGGFRVSLHGAGPDGVTVSDAFSGRVSLIHDGRPTVRVVKPATNMVARRNAVVPVEILAQASAGLSRVELHRIVNRGQDAVDSVPVPNGQRDVDCIARLDLKSLGVKPGDVVECYATAFDTNPQPMQNADSDRYWIQVATDADYARTMQQQRGPAQMVSQYRGQIEAVKRLAAEQGAIAAQAEDLVIQEHASSAPSPERDNTLNSLRSQEQELASRAGDAERDLREIAAQPAQYDIDRGLAPKMSVLAASVRSAHAIMDSAGKIHALAPFASTARAAATQLRSGLSRAGAPADRALNALEKTLPLYRDFAEIRKLADRELHVAQGAHVAEQRSETMGRVESHTASRLTSLSAEQTAIRSDLEAMRDGLSRHAEAALIAAPDAARTAKKALAKIKKERLLEEMRQITDFFDNQDAIDSAGLADQAHEVLVSLLQIAEQGRRQAATALESQSHRHLGSGARNTLQQMANRPDAQNPSSGTPPAKSGDAAAPPPPPGSRPSAASGTGQGGGGQPTAAGLTVSSSGPRAAPDENGHAHTAPAALRAAGTSEPGAKYGEGHASVAVPIPAGRYPAEYRRLVQDYFAAVARSR